MQILIQPERKWIMLPKFNLLLLVLLYLLARGFSSSWPSELKSLVVWDLQSDRPLQEKSTQETPPFSGSLLKLVVGPENSKRPMWQMTLPEDFGHKKFYSFSVKLRPCAAMGDFQLGLCRLTGEEVCRVKLAADGKIWVTDLGGSELRTEQVGSICLSTKAIELAVGLNLASSQILIKLDGASCRPLYLESLDTKSSRNHVSEIKAAEFEFIPSAIHGESSGQLLQLAVSESRN